jgi:hypothetical protein
VHALRNIHSALVPDALLARLIREDRSVYNLVQELTARVKQVR